jgi:hypothetical protein
MTTEDELIRARVRIEQLETTLRDIAYIIADYHVNEAEDALEEILKLCDGSLPTPPSPPTEAYVHRELQAGEDGL